MDKEKVIKGLEYHLKELIVGKTCFECPYCGDNPCEIQLIADALAMLKEQEAVTRCKDCKYAHKTYNGDCKYCDMFTDDDGNPIERYRSGDWFCADGKRRVDDD